MPMDLIPRYAERGMIGAHREGYGCPGQSAVEYGLSMMEVESADSGLCTPHRRQATSHRLQRGQPRGRRQDHPPPWLSTAASTPRFLVLRGFGVGGVRGSRGRFCPPS
ncbi:hypothetical protein [Corynebacterium qintianiae]|uniref:hypothetical protein n=1 Tax=Corynebacterium qintianiae TaxID=2709392 RepID=UPI002E2DA93F|nr:hypothetical protein [Corynebacterium qintianiae]